MDVLELLGELVSEVWVPPKRHMSRLVIAFPLVLSCQRNDRSREGSKGSSNKRFVHLIFIIIQIFFCLFLNVRIFKL